MLRHKLPELVHVRLRFLVPISEESILQEGKALEALETELGVQSHELRGCLKRFGSGWTRDCGDVDRCGERIRTRQVLLAKASGGLPSDSAVSERRHDLAHDRLGQRAQAISAAWICLDAREFVDFEDASNARQVGAWLVYVRELRYFRN